MTLSKARKSIFLTVLTAVIVAAITAIFQATQDPHTQATETINLNSLLGKPGSLALNEFPQVTEPRALVFPDDHLAHPAYRSEWWYFTGHLKENDQENFRYGFQFTVFRHSLSSSSSSSTGWRSSQVYMGHLAITDFEKNSHKAAELFSRVGPELAGSKSTPPTIWLKNWSITSLQNNAWLPLRIQAQVPEQNIKLDLQIDSNKPLILHGNQGYSAKGPDTASHYYSYSRLEVKGRLNNDTGEDISVNGQGWFDHEWGSSYLTPEQSGWDWFSLQLDNGMELMWFQIRSDDENLSTRAATLVSPGGERLPLSVDDVSLVTLDTWQSPSGKRYPSGWTLTIPRYQLELQIQPRIKNQEMPLSVIYWEGAVSITGSQTGAGYVELSGY